MSTPKDDAERIRQKRLARLGGGGAGASPSGSPSGSGTSTPAQQPPSTPTPISRSSSSTPQQTKSPSKPPSTPTPSTPSSSSKPNQNDTTTPLRTRANQPRRHAFNGNRALSHSPFSKEFDVWEDETLRGVFEVTFMRSEAALWGWKTVWLKELAAEIEEEEGVNKDGDAPRMTAEQADRILFTRLSLTPDIMSDDPEILQTLAALPINEGKTVLDYLTGCWTRCKEVARDLVRMRYQNKDPNEISRRLEVVDKLKGLIVGYAALSMSEPEMLPQPQGKNPGPLEFLPIVLSPDSSDLSSSSLPSPPLTFPDLQVFLTDLTNHLDSESRLDELPEILGPIVEGVGRELGDVKAVGGRKDDLGGLEWRRFVDGMIGLLEIKAVAAIVPELASFNPKTQPPLIELQCLFGPFVRMSCFPDRYPTIAQSFFPSPSTKPRKEIESAFAGLRGTLKSLQTSLFTMFNSVVRASPKSREGVLDFWGDVAKANAKRAGMQTDPRTVSSDGFMANMLAILLGFAGPIMDATYSKIDKIDPLYYKRSKRLTIEEETKINANAEEAKEYYAQDVSESLTTPPNFISEIFFMTCTYMHLGLMKTISMHKHFGRRYGNIRRELQRLENDQSWVGTSQERETRVQVERLKVLKERTESELCAYEVELFDPQFLGRVMGFVNLTMTWLIRMADPKGQHPQTPISLPLPEEAPARFRMLPEFIVEDISEFLPFLTRYVPQVVANQSKDELLTFIILCLSTSYLKNPYLRGQLVEVLFCTIQPMTGYAHGPLGDSINYNPLALEYLASGLITIYIDIETTGSHTQFYDKFTTRYYVSQIFRFLWANPTYREALKKETRNIDKFVRFINLMMNDTTFVLDESLSKLAKIHDLEKEKANPLRWEALTDEEREDRESQLESAESQAKSNLDLCAENLHTFKAFTLETRKPFFEPEIVDRLAAMLDFNLETLAGPKCQNLKVADPERYHFRPKQLLGDILELYLNLWDAPEFQRALARDGRSYSRSLFERAEGIAKKAAIKTADELKVLREMVGKVEEIKAQDAADEEMGDYPDEFLDPLTYTLMNDPVFLPSSKTVVDRSTIKQHLLSDPTDPFNRSPLKIEEIQPATELKAQIEEFVKQRYAGRE